MSSVPAAPSGAGKRALGEHSGRTLKQTHRLAERIGESVRAEVYRGEDLAQQRPVAVKILGPAARYEAEALARFKLEVEIVQRLAHPHIARTYHTDELPGGRPYVVMELLEGETLAARLGRQGRLPVTEVVRIVSQVGAALSAMHRHSIAHRDLRPKKVFLAAGCESPDFVKVLDFGLGSLKAGLLGHRPDAASRSYQAPEVAMGRTVADHRVDAFALAIVAYELLTGQHPFAPRTAANEPDQKKRAPPTPPSKLCSGLPDSIDRVILRALEEDPRQRYDDVSRFVAALCSAAGGSTTRQRRVRGTSPGAQATAKPSVSPAAGSVFRLSEARSAFLDGRLDDAVASAEQLWEAAVLEADPEARRVVATSLSLLGRIFSERLGSLDARIGVGPAGRDLERIPLTPKAREMVQLADSNITAARLIAASGMPLRDAERMLAGLLRRRWLVKL